MTVPIFPPLDGSCAERFPQFARSLKTAQEAGDRDMISLLLDREVDWISAADHLGDQRLIYEACVRVLTDLVRLRWRVVEQGYGFALQNPKEIRGGRPTEELIASKALLREELRPVVEEQRNQPAVQDFLARMESEGRGKRSVTLLVANGEELADRLEPARSLQGEARFEALRNAVKPYLERATETPDPVTGHSLREIWRYFRYRWSIPQVPVPGRQLLYLVRDAAIETRPVIGIAALNNCPLEMGEKRENFIGWHRRALLDRIAKAADLGSEELEGEIEWIEGRIAASLSEIDWTNLVTPEEVANPTKAVIRRLNLRKEDFSRRREDLLREAASGDRDSFEAADWEDVFAPPVDDDILKMEAKASVDARMHAARKQLVAKKRANALARLLQARLTIRAKRASLINPNRVDAALEEPDVVTAINIVLEALKARRAGANLLEITTCGAIHPYAPLLGGKLVALMMLSPEVGADYRTEYAAPSIISSQMRNRPVIRDNALVYLGTTSLYVHGSSQYNRLKLPAGTIAADQGELAYVEVGETSGYGTVQFSLETSRAIDAWLSTRDSFREVNSVFGEGTSPKLRKLKSGLKSIGFDPDKLIQHRQRRLIYAAPFWSEACEWLIERTEDMPSYVERPDDFRDASERIADFWRCRWLAKRIERTEAIDAARLDIDARVSEGSAA